MSDGSKISWTYDVENFDLVANYYVKRKSFSDRYRFRLFVDKGNWVLVGDARRAGELRKFSDTARGTEEDGRQAAERILKEFLDGNMEHIYEIKINRTDREEDRESICKRRNARV